VKPGFGFYPSERGEGVQDEHPRRGLGRDGAKWRSSHAPSAGGARAGRHVVRPGFGVHGLWHPRALARASAVGATG
jgi:hypothetical protein